MEISLCTKFLDKSFGISDTDHFKIRMSPDPERPKSVFWIQIQIQILPFPQKSVERTEIIPKNFSKYLILIIKHISTISRL